MKLSLLVLVFLCLAAVAVVSFMAGRGHRHPTPLPAGNARPEPVRRALVGESGSLEVLVLRRPIESGSSEFLDASLAAAVGVKDPDSWDFLEMLLVNRGEESLGLSETDLRLRRQEGGEVLAQRISSLPLVEPLPSTSVPFLSVYSSAGRVLPPSSERREVMAVPSGVNFEDWTTGTFGEIELAPARVDARLFRAWLLGETRPGKLLKTVLVEGS